MSQRRASKSDKQGRLANYRAKRSFTRSPEPTGDSALSEAEYPRFVIQKHDATRLHYDFRLEIDGVLKSWAVTRGPSLDPQQKRLAVEVEDHPLAYGDFEGTIPKGEYGGGTVMIWDRGFWSPASDKPAAEALEEGELKLTLAGSKLRGGFVLVRMARDREGGHRTNWLLIKHRDDYAKPDDDDGILGKDRSVASGRTMTQIAKGTGKPPQPFFLSRDSSAAAPDAVWSSQKKSSQRSAAADDCPPPPLTPVNADGNRVLGVTISNPDKAMWPPHSGGSAVSKIELAEYLATVGPWMLQHIGGRPCSLLRAPDGIDAETFFQRHAHSGTDAVTAVKVKGDTEPYLQIDTVEGLIAMCQLAALEFHPWNSLPGNPERPGRLVFDLDPAPDVAFSDVVEAAKEMRGRLEALGFIAFCKTTGGKGLHVVTPLADEDDGLGWSEAKTFAQALSTRMANDKPGRYLTSMSKDKRKGRIFIDYLRNDRGATAVAPLSPRARPGARVSMPLTWTQVRKDLDPTRFTIRTAASLLTTSSAWSDYDGASRSLRKAIEAFVSDEK